MTKTSVLMKLVLLSVMTIDQSALAQTIPIYTLEQAPILDGDPKDWSTLPGTTVPLHKAKSGSLVKVESITVKGGTHEDRVYLFLEWEDQTEDKTHKPWVWNEESKKYHLGPQREDRLAVQFAMEGDYSTMWDSGREFKADTWHWKASRSNPLGIAHDKSFAVSRSKLLKSYKLSLSDGGHVYFVRPSDSGDKLYRTKRYRRFDQRTMPKYVLSKSPKGSVADVSARGVWSDGRWQLELSRKLNTNNRDDVVFPLKSGKIKGGIAVFDRSENDDHAISETLTFEFKHQPRHQNKQIAQ